MYPEQRELVFHDTVGLPLEQLEKGRRKAVRQKDIILNIFRQFPNTWFTPYQIQQIYQENRESILITSVRRSITDLTKEEKLIKGSADKQVMEIYGVHNNQWKFSLEYTEGVLAFMERTKDDAPEITDVEIEDFTEGFKP